MRQFAIIDTGGYNVLISADMHSREHGRVYALAVDTTYSG